MFVVAPLYMGHTGGVYKEGYVGRTDGGQGYTAKREAPLPLICLIKDKPLEGLKIPRRIILIHYL